MPVARVSRRAFLESGAVVLTSPFVLPAQGSKPNILWLTAEDMGPNLRACGDEYSITPNLDRLAKRGCLYNNAWSNAPVCAPARTTIISGVYPTATGSEHMRSMTRMPPGWKMFPGYLRDAGYYCTNNTKEDYNLAKPEGTWDVSAQTGHWRNRAPGQPFFAVFNHESTHEGQIRRSVNTQTFVHDPARVRIPAYHPDTPEVRRDWTQYYDNITLMDTQVQKRLDELEQDGLVDDTIIFFYGDHGAGMPRSKRFPYDSGLHVCIMAIFPEKFRHLAPKDYKTGALSQRLVGFIDLAPSMLSLAGVRAPQFYQGHAFMGPYEASPRTYAYGFRGRMDERYDLIRTLRDRRYVYVRNYNPHKIYGQYVNYMWATPTTAVWDRLYKEGKLQPPQTYFWEPKPAEELYDLQTDRDEVKNLAASPEHAAVLERFRRAHREHELAVRDVGLLPEPEFHRRAAAANATPYEIGHDPGQYPCERVLDAADFASAKRPDTDGVLGKYLQDADAGVRYWGAVGLLVRGAAAVVGARSALDKALADSSPSVRVAAAEALGTHGSPDERAKAMTTLLALADSVANGSYVAMMALNAISNLGDTARPYKERIAALTIVDPKSPERVNKEYTTRLVDRLKEVL
jgi:arylsulfatase A-like enzyme